MQVAPHALGFSLGLLSLGFLSLGLGLILFAVRRKYAAQIRQKSRCKVSELNAGVLRYPKRQL